MLENPIDTNFQVQRVKTSDQISHSKERIMHIWELRVCENIPPASSKSILVLRSKLPEILDNLVTNLSSSLRVSNGNKTGQIGGEHGVQRAGLQDYTFSQVLHEYRMLRQVIFEVLDEEKLLPGIRNIVLDTLDESIENAIKQFSEIRSQELNRSNRDLEHFAAIAAHDLKSPLATIAGFTELLDDSLRGKIDVDESEYILAIKRSSARMTLLIDRLLEYSSIGREVKPFSLVPVNEVVSNVIENLNLVIEKLGAKIHFQDLPTVFGDASLLAQIFQNFINNALKYRSPLRVPEIDIRAVKKEQSWLFSIQDNGIGFDVKDKENIFSLFKRLDNVKSQSGLGIGLATIRKAIELHGGSVWADSKIGLGSIFYFTLPSYKESSLSI